jgi:hypothetical protein
MLKRAEKQDKDAKIPVAKPAGEPIDVRAGLAKSIARFPKVIARLGK